MGIAIISGIKPWFVEIRTRVASKQPLIVLNPERGIALISCDNDCWPSFWQLFFVQVARNFGPWRRTTCKQQTIGVCLDMHVYMVARFSMILQYPRNWVYICSTSSTFTIVIRTPWIFPLAFIVSTGGGPMARNALRFYLSSMEMSALLLPVSTLPRTRR